MPRTRRHCRAHSFQHVISRFVDGEFRFIDDEDRTTYLTMLGAMCRRVDWRIVCFALMSNHVHTGAWAGDSPLYRFFHPLHSRFGNYWHRRHGGMGAVFSERPKNFEVRGEHLAELIAYVHMNPVRAGIVRRPSESRWTSHRIFMRLEPVPVWLDIEWALSLCGFSDSVSGRLLFDQFVNEHEQRHWQGNETSFCGSIDRRPRDTSESSRRLFSQIDVKQLSAAVEEITGIKAALWMSRSRVRSVVQARRLFAYAAVAAGQSRAETARILGMTCSSLRELLQKAERLEGFLELADKIGVHVTDNHGIP